MPPNGATQQGVGMTEERDLAGGDVHSQRGEEIKRGGENAGAREGIVFTGRRRAERCHMVNGKGRAAGAGLDGSSGLRARRSILTESLRNPSKRLAQGIFRGNEGIFRQEYETANVTAADGNEVSGP